MPDRQPPSTMPAATPATSQRSDPARSLTVLAAVPAALAAVLGFVVGVLAGSWLLGVALAIAAAGAVAWWAVRALAEADEKVLAALGGRPADERGEARLLNLVDGLALAAGVPAPSVVVVDDPAANALSVGRTPRDATLVVTSGLLSSLDRIELEAVVAHELAHIRAGDAAAVVGAAALLAPLARVAPGPAGRLSARISGEAAAERSERDADLAAAMTTRYPPGLASALERIAASGTAVARTNPVADRLWLAPPDPTTAAPALEARAQLLREL